MPVIGARLQRRDQRGAAALEFGLIAPILIMLIVGVIQFSMWFWAWQAGASAAREAARYAAVKPCDTGQIQAIGTARLDGVPKTGTATVAVTTPNPSKIGDDITVKITFTTVDLHFFPGFTGAVTKSATSRVENLPAGGCS